MPLANMHDPNRMQTESRLSRRAVLGIVAAGTATLLVAGCSSGSSREAERARERDAERTSVVDEMQQTATSSLVLGTPSATPGTDDEADT